MINAVVLYLQILLSRSTKANSMNHTSYDEKLLNDEDTDSEGQARTLKKALIFMIDAYSHSGIIQREEIMNMLEDIMLYYQERSMNLGSYDR